jgi:hypothetical protein
MLDFDDRNLRRSSVVIKKVRRHSQGRSSHPEVFNLQKRRRAVIDLTKPAVRQLPVGHGFSEVIAAVRECDRAPAIQHHFLYGLAALAILIVTTSAAVERI